MSSTEEYAGCGKCNPVREVWKGLMFTDYPSLNRIPGTIHLTPTCLLEQFPSMYGIESFVLPPSPPPKNGMCSFSVDRGCHCTSAK
jgi:hypothetical protein